MALDELDNVWVTELLFTVDAQTADILDASGDVEAALGLDPSLLLGRPLFASVHRDDVDQAIEAFEKVKANGRATWEGRVGHVAGSFVELAWEGRLGVDGSRIYARSRDAARARATLADLRIYERLADLTSDLFIVADNHGRVVRANRAAMETYNQTEETLVGTPLSDFVNETSRTVFDGIPERVAMGNNLIPFRLPVLDGRGGDLVVEGAATFDDVTGRWYVVQRDVTERVAREHELEVAQRFFDLSTSQLVLVDGDDRILQANAAFVDAVGLPRRLIEGTDIAETLGATQADDLRRTLEEVRYGRCDARREVGVTVRGSIRRLEVDFASAREGGIVYLSGRDVTEQRDLQNELMRRATRDGLTGLVNRASLVDAVEADLASGKLTTFVMLDLDGFKHINDSLGHAAGDELLVQIGDRLDQRTRGVDLVARFGGDEFAILLRGVPDAATALLVAEKLRRALGEPFEVLGRPVNITASVGATIGRASTHTCAELLLEADLAAYSAKENGTDQSRVFDDKLRATTDFSHALEDHLRRVLGAATFELEVVPVTALDGSIVGVGVNAPAIAISGARRWNAQSMFVAKKLGLLGPISMRLVKAAVSGLAPWLHAHPGAHLDMLFDVAEVAVAGFAEQLLVVLDQHGVPADSLVASLAGVAEAGIQSVDLDAIDELRRAGVRVSFAGSRADTNTLAALHLRCIDRIDVDTTRIALAPEGSVERVIASTVFDVADRLGVEVVADASFAPDVVDTVSIFPNCSPTGLVFGRPVPLDDFLTAAVSGQGLASDG